MGKYRHLYHRLPVPRVLGITVGFSDSTHRALSPTCVTSSALYYTHVQGICEKDYERA